MAAVTPHRRWFLSDHPAPWLLPLVAILVVFAIYPLIYNVWLSFHEYASFRRRVEYVGWANWIQLFNDPRMWSSLTVTFIYFFAALALQLVLGMALALLLDADEPGFGLLRGLLTLTLVIPPAVTGMMFLLMEDPQFGVLSWLLNAVGLLTPATPILATPSLALAGVLLADVWQWTPFMVLIFLAGLRGLPPEPYEAAMLDGASWWTVFTRITLPMMAKVIAVAVLIRGIDLFRVFDYIFVMTSGGPGEATYTLSLYAWQQTFSFIKWGYGATLSLLMLVIVLVMANLFIWLAKVRW
ncbi:carbohydrate ABC transporter permease [Rubrimonas cliftonensis]|uniref:Carbohydrate ABC transporter membrane protein 1, CUT1 family n=1 Tax=Rubrimonas cliftonensis TaxID=89524 RepID=A0A1H4DJ09_9RHOB|nr:sugar ABC transporter permease [Rubrimonas cliftonensis]SEA72410.1 carbohydrate ABC transporter membrane protein 1, CUT1 family [Rubrimonas cliftonensis]